MFANSECALCNLKCGADRGAAAGFCGIDDKLYIAHWGLHFGEEPFLIKGGGSGTIFFAGCSLRCRFCQNHRISRWPLEQGAGVSEYGVESLVDIFFKLKSAGAANINFVSPTPYVPFIGLAVKEAKLAGFNLPFVYNSHGNDSLETVKSLADIIDIYLPDMKYGSDELGLKFSGVDGLYSYGRETIKAMYEQKGALELNADGRAVCGVAVRHLVIPGEIESSLGVMDFLETIDRKLTVSLMSQFHPPFHDGLYGHLNARLTRDEYGRVVSYAEALGFENLLIQDVKSSDNYLPNFGRKKVFADI
ncbi:MAG: radical SAM protein [Leptospirales bacterium]|nr:radical SAM protein [Leptospirales bacterium]